MRIAKVVRYIVKEMARERRDGMSLFGRDGQKVALMG